MDDQITEFMDILRDNAIDTKYPEAFKEFTGDELKKKIKEIGKIPAYFLLNGFDNTIDFAKYLNSHFGSFKIAYIANNLANNKSFQSEMANQIQSIKYLLSELKDRFKLLNIYSLDSLLNLKIQYCDRTISFLNDQAAKNPITKLKPKVTPTNLKQNQVVILFYHLRKLKYIGIDIDNKSYAQYISVLTGYAAEKIRQDLSHISSESYSVERVLFQVSDYRGIIRELNKLIVAIDKDSKDKFPPLP
jgi:hypothetical protein